MSDAFLRRRMGQFFTAQVLGREEATFFRYRTSGQRNYQRFNEFVQGMEWVKAQAAVFTSDEVSLAIGDVVRLENGPELKIVNITPFERERRGMYQRNAAEGYLIQLE